MKKVLLFVFVFFMFSLNVFADCSYTEQAELLNKAANVKASYEIKNEVVHFVDMDANIDYFNIQLYNLSEDFYAIVRNDYNSASQTLRSTDAKDGVITYRWNNLDNITNFTIEVYASGSSNCTGEKFKTLYIQTPRFNEYYDREICKELTDFYLCQKYITINLPTEERFFEQLDSYKSGRINNQGDEIDNRNIFDKTIDFIKDNKWYILGGLVLITGGAVFVYTKKNKKRRELGL